MTLQTLKEKARIFAAYHKKVPCERCVVCGAMTDVPQFLPIENRSCYVEGCGQICRQCYRKLYVK